jgi:hypothetical protein
MSKLSEFESEIATVINKHGVDSFTKTPDYILAKYVVTCIASLKTALVEKETHEKL